MTKTADFARFCPPADRAVATPEVKMSLVRLLRVMKALISFSRAALASPMVPTFLPVMA